MNCINCEIETNNPKFCSRSCAATYNNVKYPKRKPESTCKKCKNLCTTNRSYCKKCWLEECARKSVEKWETCTLKEMKGVGNANAGGRYPYIRTLARRKYLLSNKPQYCVVANCTYKRKFDVAHIKDIRSYKLTATVAEVNHIDNLIALCKNHHTDFDEGYLTDPINGLPSLVGKARVGFAKVS